MRSGPVTGLNRFPLLKGFKGKARKRMTRGSRGRLAANAVLSETIALCGGVLRHSRRYYNTQKWVLQAKGFFSPWFAISIFRRFSKRIASVMMDGQGGMKE